MNDKNQLEIFYDGACHLCSREIVRYKRLDHSGTLKFVNIAAPGFRAGNYLLDAGAVQKRMHVRRNGDVYQGVDAFLEIWKEFPQLAVLGKIISLPGVYQLATLGYALFASIRRFLPKRKGEQCDLN
jgi:predicted DCC family thiol-disulfide oxidoreductase YuxK